MSELPSESVKFCDIEDFTILKNSYRLKNFRKLKKNFFFENVTLFCRQDLLNKSREFVKKRSFNSFNKQFTEIERERQGKEIDGERER